MTTLALQYFRSAPRYVGARTLGSKAPGLIAGPLAPLRLASVKDPEPPAGRSGWARVRPLLSGICGSDLSTLAGRSSFYFSPLVSTPFVPGHEVVGELLDDCGDLQAGQRVVLSSVLSCEARGEEPPCANCASGDTGRCDRVAVGHLKPGLQTGYCNQTGGGWGRMFVAHRSQLHAIPDGLSDAVAVLVEPFACAIHAALRARAEPDQSVLIVGAGTVGILTLIALRLFAEPGHVTVASGLDLALRSVRAGGRVVVSGIPATGADLTPLWFRELDLVGAYTSGTEALPDGTREPTFDLAIRSSTDLPILERLVGATYPLDRWREAIDHAMSAGKLGTFKVAFAPQG